MLYTNENHARFASKFACGDDALQETEISLWQMDVEGKLPLLPAGESDRQKMAMRILKRRIVDIRRQNFVGRGKRKDTCKGMQAEIVDKGVEYEMEIESREETREKLNQVLLKSKNHRALIEWARGECTRSVNTPQYRSALYEISRLRKVYGVE